jgi:antitoxin component of RelBE/YafQ-DinJ toxin-antitoxin module
MTKVQLSLTDEEAAILSGYGEQFGYSLPKVIRYLISKATERAIREKTVPVYSMGEKTEKKGLQALKEHEKGKTSRVDNVDDYFDAL